MASKITLLALLAAVFTLAASQKSGSIIPVRDNRGRIAYYQVPNNRVQSPVRPVPVRDNQGRIQYYKLSTVDNRGKLVDVSVDVLANSRPVPVRNQQGRVVYQAIQKPGNDELLSVNTNDLLRIQLDLDAKVTAVVNADISATLKVRGLLASWNKLAEKLKAVVEKTVAQFEKVKQKSIETYKKVMENVIIMKEKGQELLEKVNQTAKEFIAHGKIIYVDFMSLYDTIKDAYKNIKESGQGVKEDLKEVVDELKKAAVNGQLLVEAKKEKLY